MKIPNILDDMMTDRVDAIRTADITFVLDGAEIDAETLALLKSVWNRAYILGQWRGIDLARDRVNKALSAELQPEI